MRTRPLRTLTWMVLAAGCGLGRGDGPTDGSGGRLAPGDHEITLRHGGRNRASLVHVPATARSARALPLLLAFHGGGGEASGFRDYAGLDALAEREGFVVAYPFGSGILPRLLLTWNAGANCCGWALDNGIDDVGFAIALIDEISRRVTIDPRRIYATGHSNGSMMAYRLAAEQADRIAAIVPVAGAMDLPNFAPSRPVPVLHIHSLDDPRALYEGGLGPPFPGTNRRVDHQPVEAALQRWRQRNGCATGADTAETRRGASGTPDAGQSALRLVWTCSGASVEHWQLRGSGHGWPGNPDIGLREELIGPPTTLVNAADEAWRFLSRHRR